MAEEELSIVIRARDEAAKAFRATQNQLKGLQNQMRGAGRAAKDFAKRADVVGQRWQKAGNDMRAAGMTMTIGITAPMGLLAGLAVKSFADFDAAMVKSLAIMGDVSAAQKGEMSEAARTVAKETTFSAEQAAESYFFLASAGLDATQSIKAMPQVSRFAQAGMFDMALATDLLTDAQSALGLSVDDTAENLENMTRVSDVLVKANTLANATVQQFSESLTNKAGAALRVVGKEVEEGVAVLAAFADQGVKGAEAGEKLNIVLRDLQVASLKEKDAFEQVGVAVFDASGEMRNMADIIGDMEGALMGLSDEQVRTTLTMMGFQDRSVAALMALIGTSGAIRDYETALKDAGGTTDEVAEKQLESFSAQMSLLKSRIQDVMITLGEQLVPMLITLMDVLEPLLAAFITGVNIFSQMPGPVQAAAVAFAALVAAIGPILTVLGFFVSGVGQIIVLMKGLVTALNTARTAMIAFNASIPAVGVLLAVASAVALLTNGFGLFGGGSKDATRDLQLFNDEMERLDRLMGGLSGDRVPFLTTELSKLTIEWNMHQKAIDDAAGSVDVQLRRAADDAKDSQDELVNSFAAVVVAMGEEGVAHTELMNMMQSRGIPVIGALADELDKLAEQEAVTAAEANRLEVEQTQMLDSILDAALRTGPKTAGQLELIAEAADIATQAIVENFGQPTVDALAAVAEQAGITYDDLVSGIDPTVDSIEDMATTIENRLGKDVAASFVAMAEAGTEAMENTRSVIKGMLPTLGETFDEWNERMRHQAQLFLNFGRNYQFILRELENAHVENIDLIMQAVQEGGPEVAQAMAFHLAERGVDGVRQNLGLLDDVANVGMGNMAHTIETDGRVHDAVVSTTGEAMDAAADVAGAGGRAAGLVFVDEFAKAVANAEQIPGLPAPIFGTGEFTSGAAAAAAAHAAWQSMLLGTGPGFFSPGGGGAGGSNPLVDEMEEIEEAAEEMAEEVMDAVETLTGPQMSAMLQMGINGFKQYKQEIKNFSQEGADVLQNLYTAIENQTPESVDALTRAAARMIEAIEEEFPPERAGAVGDGFMEALRRALDEGSQQALENLRDVLSEINTEFEEALEETVDILGVFTTKISELALEKKFTDKYGALGEAIISNIGKAITENDEQAAAAAAGAAFKLLQEMEESLPPAKAAELGAALMSKLTEALETGSGVAIGQLKFLLEDIQMLLADPIEIPPVDTEELEESLKAAGVIAQEGMDAINETVEKNFMDIDPAVIEKAVLDAFGLLKELGDPLTEETINSIHEAFAPFTKAVDKLARTLGGVFGVPTQAHPGFGGAGSLPSGGGHVITLNMNIYLLDGEHLRDAMPDILREARGEIERNFISGG